ncbi:MAG TPA: TetR/AcrR family transcriptional regulator [Spirochaetota bacterium]|nr:TetR/AcrR family transcriptional regulator [Spirochaetota bacterium]HPI89568.1 TetR/AcrR family transcriptional regulator [Spirochaetota bacterium]HPR49032.1 TetR/AcrR family transcriptional regulator [Spirochaetota bacterium]
MSGSDKSFNSLKNRERKVRQDIIITAAERVFSSKPFDQVSIRDIAKEAGISHALIYRYFPDQQTLFVEAFLRGAEKIVNFLQNLISGHEEGNIEKVTEKFLKHMIKNDHYFRMMTHFMLDGTLSAEMVERLNAMERKLLDQFDRLFDTKNTGGDDVRILSHAYFSAMNGILISYRNYPGRARKDVTQHMMKLGKIIASRFSR